MLVWLWSCCLSFVCGVALPMEANLVAENENSKDIERSKQVRCPTMAIWNLAKIKVQKIMQKWNVTTIMQMVNMEQEMETLQGLIMVEVVVDMKEEAEAGVILAEVATTKSIETAKICYQEMSKSLILQAVSSYYVKNFDCKPLYKKYRIYIKNYTMPCFCRYPILFSRLIFTTSLKKF